MALTKEEREKIIEEETLRNEIREKQNKEEDSSLLDFVSAMSFITVIVYGLYMFYR